MYSDGSARPSSFQPDAKTIQAPMMSPRVQPAPQWLTPMATDTGSP